MKLLVSLLFSLLLMTSCSSVKILSNQFPCDKTEQEMKNNLSTIMTEEGFSLMSGLGKTYRYVSSVETTLGMSYDFSWDFTISEKIIIATPKLNIKEGYSYLAGKIYPSSVVLGDNTAEEHSTYWNVRARLEMFCGAKVIVITDEGKKRKSMKSQSLSE